MPNGLLPVFAGFALTANLFAADPQPARPGVGKFLNQPLGDVKPVAAGAALADGGLRDPFLIPAADATLPSGELEPRAEPPIPAAAPRLGGMHRFGSVPAFSAVDGRMALPVSRTTYSFNMLPRSAGARAFRHGLGIEWAPPSGAFGVAARFAANGLDSNQSNTVGDFGGEAKLLLAQAPGFTAVGGVAVDAPFGSQTPGTSRPDAVVGPFIAGLLSQPGNPWFVQLAERLDLPVGSSEPKRLRTSLGLGHWIRAGGSPVVAWAPAAELHFVNPLGGAERSSLHAALGFTALYGGGATFGAALGVPLFGAGGALDGRVHLS